MVRSTQTWREQAEAICEHDEIMCFMQLELERLRRDLSMSHTIFFDQKRRYNRYAIALEKRTRIYIEGEWDGV